ncbi:MAG TPA: hypothetical protein VGN72_24050 [Tepidisphaeraceae bacterium]|nr:hypothetical protein [Tepidisphaeraceae bacterium]
MNADTLKSMASKWSKLGAMIGGSVDTSCSVDVEQLLLDTARCASSNVRLFELAVTWLASYGHVVNARRLTKLIRLQLELAHRPTMGLMLETAAVLGPVNASLRYGEAIAACGRAIDQRPLSDASCSNDVLRGLAERTASGTSRRWGRWIETFDLKLNALRPRDWVAEHNPSLFAA